MASSKAPSTWLYTLVAAALSGLWLVGCDTVPARPDKPAKPAETRPAKVPTAPEERARKALEQRRAAEKAARERARAGTPKEGADPRADSALLGTDGAAKKKGKKRDAPDGATPSVMMDE